MESRGISRKVLSSCDWCSTIWYLVPTQERNPEKRERGSGKWEFFLIYFPVLSVCFENMWNFLFKIFYSECTCILKVEHGNVLFFLVCVNMEIFSLFFLFFHFHFLTQYIVLFFLALWGLLWSFFMWIISLNRHTTLWSCYYFYYFRFAEDWLRLWEAKCH